MTEVAVATALMAAVALVASVWALCEVREIAERDARLREPESDAQLRLRVLERQRAEFDEMAVASGEELDAWAWEYRIRRKGT